MGKIQLKVFDCFKAIRSLEKLFSIKGVEILRGSNSRLYVTSLKKQLILILFNLLFSCRLKKSLHGISDSYDFIYFSSSNVLKKKHTKEMEALLLDYLDEYTYTQFRSEELLVFFSFLEKIILTFKYFKKINAVKLPIIYRLLISSSLAKGELDVKYINNEISSALERSKLVLTFCDAIGHDNLACQISNLAGKTTVTVQHGQYRHLNESNISADCEAYENFSSNYLLSWGDETEAEFSLSGDYSGRFLHIGRLLKSAIVDSSLHKKDKSSVFGVVLCGENQSEYNIKLLQFANVIAKELSLKYYVRTHPSNNKNKYKVLCSSNCIDVKSFENIDYLNSCDFSIMGMSGVFIDFIDVKHPFFFFDNGYLAKTFINSGLAINHPSQIPSLLDLLNTSSDYFLKLKNKYNNNDNQKVKLIRFLGSI